METQNQNIENRLAQAFQRVTPSRAFVNTVRERIQHTQPPMVVRQFSRRRRDMIFALGGVLSVSLLILTIARVVYYLLGRSKQAA
jgi:aspartokinase